MSKIKRDIIIYTGLCILFIAIGLLLSHRQFSPHQDFRIRSTDFSIIWYTSFLFLPPLLVKFVFYKMNLQDRFVKIFNIQLVIAIVTSIVPIYIMIDESSVKTVKEDFAFDFESDIYLFYVLCKLCVIASIGLILILLLYQLGLRFYKNYIL
jgi:hypothetical protein